MCCVLLEMLDRGWWILESGNGLFFFFLALLCSALLAFALPALQPHQVQSQAFSRSGFPPRYTNTTPSTSLWRTAHHILVAAPLMSKGNSKLGRWDAVFALGANVLWCSSVWGLFPPIMTVKHWMKYVYFRSNQALTLCFLSIIVCKCIGSLNHCVMVINLLCCESSK